jgi:hypothetical protein
MRLGGPVTSGLLSGFAVQGLGSDIRELLIEREGGREGEGERDKERILDHTGHACISDNMVCFSD